MCPEAVCTVLVCTPRREACSRFHGLSTSCQDWTKIQSETSRREQKCFAVVSSESVVVAFSTVRRPAWIHRQVESSCRPVRAPVLSLSVDLQVSVRQS